MGSRLTPQEYIAALRREGGALAQAARQDPTRPVPYYPGWSVADLVAHTGAVHRWVLGIVRSRATERVPREPYEDRDPLRLLAWFEEGLAALAGELRAADPSEPVWSFGADQTVGFWQRRMAHETAIHRWDAQSAFGDAQPIEPRLAATGIGESLASTSSVPCTAPRSAGTASRWRSAATMPRTGGLWCCSRTRSASRRVKGQPPPAWPGPASDVWLFVTGRPAMGIRVSGDGTVVARLQRRHPLSAGPDQLNDPATWLAGRRGAHGEAQERARRTSSNQWQSGLYPGCTGDKSRMRFAAPDARLVVALAPGRRFWSWRPHPACHQLVTRTGYGRGA